MGKKTNKYDTSYLKKQAVNKKKKMITEELMKKRLRTGVMIFAAAFIIMSVMLLTIEYTNSYIAKISGRRITTEEYKYFLSNEKFYMLNEVKDPGMDEATFWSTKIDGEDPLVITKNRALDSIKAFNIEKIKAKKDGVKLNADERRNAAVYVDNMLGQYYSTRAAKDEYLKAYIGISYAKYVDIIEDYFLVLKYRDEVKATIEVSEEQVKEYYDANKDDVDKVTMHHMLVDFDKYLEKDAEGKTVPGATLTDEQKEKARGDAVGILAQVDEGQAYDVILKKFYGDEYNEEEMTFEFTFKKGDNYLEDIKDWAFSNEAGSTGMIESEYGFHIVKLVKRTDYEEIKDDAKAAILTEKYNEQLEEWKKNSIYDLRMNERIYNGIE